MKETTVRLLFALLRSVICNTALSEEEKTQISSEELQSIVETSQKHDILHLVALALKQNKIAVPATLGTEKSLHLAIYRYELLRCEYEKICKAFEEEKISFIPLKGSVLRQYYPEPWMRTSCDIDILVQKEDLSKAARVLTDKYSYSKFCETQHDMSFFSPNKVHIELHHTLIEDGRINKTYEILNSVWDTVSKYDNDRYCCNMSDEMFYFYHIAHMAKHFETGGCGIRPFIDLWLLDNIDGADASKREELLRRGELLKFAESVSKLCRIWLEGAVPDEISQHIEEYILYGGVYGTLKNAYTMKAVQGETKIKNLFRLVFLSRSDLTVCYPNLNRHPMLFPFYQVKRWFKIFNKSKRDKIKGLTITRNSVSKQDINSASELLEHLGLTD